MNDAGLLIEHIIMAARSKTRRSPKFWSSLRHLQERYAEVFDPFMIENYIVEPEQIDSFIVPVWWEPSMFHITPNKELTAKEHDLITFCNGLTTLNVILTAVALMAILVRQQWSTKTGWRRTSTNVSPCVATHPVARRIYSFEIIVFFLVSL